MKRRTLSDAVSEEERRFIEAGTPQSQTVSAVTHESPPIVPAQAPITKKAGERKRPPAPELPVVLVSQTYRLPADLVKDLTKIAVERKLDRRAPWSHQDIVADALRDWISKHAHK
jgi:hypothetical protein